MTDLVHMQTDNTTDQQRLTPLEKQLTSLEWFTRVGGGHGGARAHEGCWTVE